MNKIVRLSIIASTILLLFTSCLPRKKMKYITEMKDQASLTNYHHQKEEKEIGTNDKLYIKILSLDEQTSQLFQDQSRMYGGESNMNLISYRVNESGNIDFPFVGEIHVKGYTLAEAKNRLEEELSEYMPNTSIRLKYAANYVTVLGEVRRPGNHLFYDDQINIFKALGYAGGIQDYGNKQEVILVREDGQQINYSTVDITTKKVAETRLYYLMPNDVIIVQPLNNKFKTLRNFQLESLILSSVTTLITVSYFFLNL